MAASGDLPRAARKDLTAVLDALVKGPGFTTVAVQLASA